MTQEELESIEHAVTQEVIEEQVRAGIDLVTDGQVGWEDGQTYFARRIQGFTINGLIRYFDTNTYYRQPVAQGRLRWQGPIAVEDFRFATAHSPRPVKPVITGPYTLARLSRTEHHTSLVPMVMELAEALNQEAQELAKAGATIIQVDEPAILQHPADYSLFRDAMARLTQGLTPTLALSTYFGDVSGLGPAFFDLPFHVFGLDFVMGPGNWQALAEFPREKSLAAGLLDARNTKLETAAELVASLRRIKARVPLERLYVNPSCGLEFLPRDAAYQKLARLVEGAQRAQEVLT
jgi:5-methyltetrahydropteroyltriglutamate--homocysteine methyltransferase